MSHELFDRHRDLLDKAVAATRSREYFSAYDESPSPRVYGEDAAPSGKAAFESLLGSTFPLSTPGASGTVSTEKSPFGFELGVSYPRVTEAGVDELLTAARAGMKAWRDAGPQARVGVCLEILSRLHGRIFELANAVQHTSGAEFATRQADLVCWLSAYEGGFPLQAYAWLHGYPIVSSVWPYHARVIDITGRIVASSSRWDRLALHTLNLDKRLFHTDGQMQHILPIRARYGSRVRLEAFTEEHLFTLESLDASLSVDEVIAEFGLVDYRTYIARCTAAQQVARTPS